MTSGRMIMVTALSVLLLLTVLPESKAQYFANFNPDEGLFNSEVKLIDEFIDRFNSNPTTLPDNEKGKPYNVKRSTLLVSLFNLQNASFTDKDNNLMGFFHQVLDPLHPVYLSFTDSDWYAEAQSVFLENGKLVEIPLVLHIKSHGDDWSKWMITGLGNKQPSKEPMPSVSARKMSGKMSAQYISTSAYATNFITLHYILSGDMVPEYFFEPQLLATGNGRQFVERIKNGQLKFQYVKTITYHFYQINGWVFTVGQYNRKTFNSGWLISGIQKTDPVEKDADRNRLLNR